MNGATRFTEQSIFTSPATTEMYPNASRVDWFLKAANYYYLAVSGLNNVTSGGYTVVSTSAVLQSPIQMIAQWQARLSSTIHNSDHGSPLRKTEEILATVALLTLYRLLDTQGEEWHS